MDDNKETKNETKSYNEKNLTKSIVFAAIITGLMILHSILGIFVSGNLPWFILNTLFTAGAVVVGLLTALFFFKTTKDNMKNDLPSFIVSLVAMCVCALCVVWWSIDTLTNLFGFIHDITSK